MTRRFNYTDRQRITSDHFQAQTISEHPLRVSLTLSLQDLKLEPEHHLVVEPYVGNVSKRILCGTVGNPEIPNVIDLSDLKTGGAIQFRVKVFQKDGLLIASGERIRLIGQDEETGRKPLLPVETDASMGDEVWRVAVGDSVHPKLILNSRVPSLKDRLVEDPVIGGAIVLPAVREVLRVLSANLGGDVWQPDWLEFARRYEPDTDPEVGFEDDDDAEDWVNKIVSAFAEDQRFASRAAELTGGDA